MNYENFIQVAIDALGMDKQGVLIGLVGAVVSVFYKVNGLNWKGTVAVFLSGAILSGYTMPVIAENLNLGKGTGFFVVFIIGYVAKDFFTALQNFGPTFFKILTGYIAKKFKHNDTNDK